MFLTMNDNNKYHKWLKLIGLKLAELRKMKGYDTVKDFALRFKLPAIHYWRIENGKANVTISSLYKILRIHKMNLEEFFCDFNRTKMKE
jgi:transcriptional regulator with XRE-family HTH domain